MFIRFGVSNFGSISEYQEILFTASNLADAPEHLLESRAVKEKLSPVLGLYGANGSGKTTILSAFTEMMMVIFGSYTNKDKLHKLNRNQFRLDPDWISKPTTFDCDFILEDVRYTYGFSYNDNEILEEWIYSYPEQKRRVLLHRNSEADEKFYFGRFLKGKNKVIEEITAKNKLWLSVATSYNHQTAIELFDFFLKTNIYDLNMSDDRKDVEKTLVKTNLVELESILKAVDLGIIRSTTTEAGRKYQKQQEEQNHQKGLLEDDDEPDGPLIRFLHSGKDGSEVEMNIEHESRGTVVFLSILPKILDVIAGGGILIVDEIESGLHSFITKKILSLFTSKELNKKNAQLLFTTHDTTLLQRGTLRRDQIWFTEKDKNGSTNVYPLTDIQTRNTDNIEQGYLKGKFGGIPFLGDIDKSFGDK